MSNINKNAAELPVEPEEVVCCETVEEAPVSKNIGARLLAILVAIIGIAALFIPVTVVGYEDAGLFNALLTAITASEGSIFGFIPSLWPVSDASIYAMLAIYVAVLCVVIAAVCGIIALFCGKKAPCLLRTVTFFVAAGYSTYAASVYVSALEFDVITIAIAAAAVALHFVLSVKKLGKTGVANSVQALFSAVVATAIVYGILSADSNTLAFVEGLNGLGIEVELASKLLYVLVALLSVNLYVASIRMQKEKGLVCDLIRFILEFIVAIAITYVAFSASTNNNLTLFAIVACVVALVQIVFTTIQIIKSREPVEEEVEEPVEEEKEDGFVIEEFAEAYPYVGGPVEGIEMAQEVNPSFLPHPPHVSTAGYDFYNSKSFDPFIAILNAEERNQFTELFILKFKGTMPELPDYVVGGDNSEFFQKIFIYLGQYRDRIPDGLLAKMYKFSIRL